jgi:hypothetical protein
LDHSGFGSIKDSDLSGFGSVRIRISQDQIGYDTISVGLSCVRKFYFNFLYNVLDSSS